MRLTGAVKLTFGCVTGLRKGQLHVRSSARADFADMLLDLHLALAPRLTVIDAIVAMQGKGPGNGTPRAMGSLFAARDAGALDAALADLTVHERRGIYTLAAAERRGLIDLDEPYRLEGDPIVPDPGFEHAPRDAQDRLPPVLRNLARNLLTSRPRLVDPGGLHPLRRLRPDLRRERHHPGAHARLRRRQVRALLRLHRDLPHGRHPGRQAAHAAPVRGQPLGAPPPAGRAVPYPPRVRMLLVPSANHSSSVPEPGPGLSTITPGVAPDAAATGAAALDAATGAALDAALGAAATVRRSPLRTAGRAV